MNETPQIVERANLHDLFIRNRDLKQIFRKKNHFGNGQ